MVVPYSLANQVSISYLSDVGFNPQHRERKRKYFTYREKFSFIIVLIIVRKQLIERPTPQKNPKRKSFIPQPANNLLVIISPSCFSSSSLILNMLAITSSSSTFKHHKYPRLIVYSNKLQIFLNICASNSSETNLNFVLSYSLGLF